MSETLIVIQPTSFCNISCKYCYLPIIARSTSQRMSIDVLEHIFRGVLSSELISDPIEFLYHKGEPLVVPKEFYRSGFERLRNLNLDYGRSFTHHFQTNGTLIDEEWATIFKEYNVRVGVSIDGPDFIHDRNRVTRSNKPTHTAVMQGIAWLQKVDVEFTVIMVLTLGALDYPDEIYDFFTSNGIRSIGFNIDEFGANAGFVSSYITSTAIQKYKHFMRRFMHLVDAGGGTLQVREFKKVISAMIALSNGTMDAYHSTNVPFKIITFDTLGNYSTFCPELSGIVSAEYDNFVMGNIFSQRIDDMLLHANFQRINHAIQAGVRACRNTCSYWTFCGGGTPSNKYYELGDLSATETLYCKIHVKALVDVMQQYLEEKRPSSTR